MPLMRGARVGPYEVAALIGEGGMGQVYRARDPRLGRDVAIKILPAAVATDPERLARFDQEARATAALNHPNILAVYDIGSVDGIAFVVSELLEGETLRDVLAHGAITTRQAVDYAVQTAHGLAAVHEKGIVHRDLKPENLFVTLDGRLKILDFGLAKLIETTPALSGTFMPTTPAGTAAGLILGTIGYMAPEQVRGQTVDPRADIFAFGAILYELLTGERAFSGESPADTISAILKEDPPQLANPAKVGNAALHRIVQRCLEKKPEQRFHSAHDLAYAIEGSTNESGIRTSAAQAAGERRPIASLLWVALASVALVAAASSYLAFRHVIEVPPLPAVARLTLTLPPGTSLATGGGGQFLFSVSPDGRSVVAALRGGDIVRLWLRPIDAYTFRPVSGTEGVTGRPFWSPDGKFVAFQVGGVLKRVAVANGSVETMATLAGGMFGSWSAEGILLTGAGVTGTTDLVWIATGSGRATPFKPDLKLQGSPPSADLLTRGRVLYSMNDGAGWSLAIGSITSTSTRPLGPVGGPVAVADGFLLMLRNTTLMAQRFDEASARLVGDPMSLDEDVLVQGLGFSARTRRGAFSTSLRNGTVAYSAGQATDTRLAWIDRDGRAGDVVGAAGLFSTITLSRDGSRVAYGRMDDTGRSSIWITDLTRNVSSRFSPLTATASELDAAWSPDGETLAFVSIMSDAKGIYRRPSAGGTESVDLRVDTNSLGLDDWSPDGRYLLYHVTGEERALPLSGDRTPVKVLSGTTRPDEARFSPDGRLIALNTEDTGRAEVYLVPFPPTGERWQVSNSGGAQPRWRGDGRELYYLALDGAMMAVTVGAGPKPELSAPKKLFDTPLFVRATTEQYAVSRNGQRFLMMWPSGNQQPQLRVILNWPSLVPR